MKNNYKTQISVTSLIFNYTIRKLQIDEKTFNENLHNIENAIINITDNQTFYDSELHINTCKQFLESFILNENELNDTINSISVTRLKIYTLVIQQLNNKQFSVNKKYFKFTKIL